MPALVVASRRRVSPGMPNACRPGFMLAAAVLGFFVVTLDATVVNVALPSVRADFGGGIGGLQWVAAGYTVMFAALLLSAGALADRIGARRAFGAGVAGFVLASAGCGLAPGLGVLVAARLVQGAAAAVMMPSSMALVGQAFADPARRARAVALWAMGGAAASSAGPVAGGLLTLASWRLIFFINVPAGAAALALLTRTVPSPRRPAPFDWAGPVTAVLAMGGLTYGAIEAGTAGLGAPRVLAAFAVVVAGLAVFWAVQARGAHPMMPLDLFRSRTVVIANVTGFAFIVGYYGLPFVMSLYLQQLRGLSPLDAGLAFVPMMLTGAVLTPFSAQLAEKLGARLLIITGLVLMTAGLVAIAIAAPAAPVWGLALLMVATGLGGPLVMPPMTAVLLNSVPGHRVGIASGIFNTSRQAGGALAVAVFGALLASRVGFVTGLRISLLIAATVALAAAAVSIQLHPRHRIEGSSSKMSDWTAADLDLIGSADELEITTRRADGSLRLYVPVWVVRVGDELFVRSWRGQAGAWYRHARQRPDGRVRAGGAERDVTFERPKTAPDEEIDRAYQAKYGRYGDTYVGPMTGPDARAATIRLTAR